MANKELDLVEYGTSPPVTGVLSFDADDYMEYVSDLDLNDSQKVELLRTLWTIMSAFVELGFGVDLVIPIVAQKASENGANALQTTTPTHAFNVAVDDEPKNEG